MQYQYNYSFLSEWMQANKKISINTILQAIGTKSNNSLRMWEQGQCAMPVIGILRFCNSFQIPISAFLCNTGEPCPTEVNPSETALFEPEGGYTTDMAQRQPGERRPLSPTDVTPTQSVIPNVETSIEENETEVVCRANQTEKSNNNVDVYKLIELQKKQAENTACYISQQQKMLDIIVKQQEEIDRLTKLLQEEKERNKPRGYSIAAEP